jgi:hypothetical protein
MGDVESFFIYNEENLALERMRETVRDLAADVDQAVVNEGWDRKAVQMAIKDIDLYIGRSHKNSKGICFRDWSSEITQTRRNFCSPKTFIR